MELGQLLSFLMQLLGQLIDLALPYGTGTLKLSVQSFDLCLMLQLGLLEMILEVVSHEFHHVLVSLTSLTLFYDAVLFFVPQQHVFQFHNLLIPLLQNLFVLIHFSYETIDLFCQFLIMFFALLVLLFVDQQFRLCLNLHFGQLLNIINQFYDFAAHRFPLTFGIITIAGQGKLVFFLFVRMTTSDAQCSQGFSRPAFEQLIEELILVVGEMEAGLFGHVYDVDLGGAGGDFLRVYDQTFEVIHGEVVIWLLPISFQLKHFLLLFLHDIFQ